MQDSVSAIANCRSRGPNPRRGSSSLAQTQLEISLLFLGHQEWLSIRPNRIIWVFNADLLAIRCR